MFEQIVGPSNSNATALAGPTIIAIVVLSVVGLLLIVLVVFFGRCKRKQTDTKNDDASLRPAALSPSQNQEPPPYYPASALHNKSMDHSLDMALAKENQKEALYGTQNDYVYYPQPTHQLPDNECK